MTIMLDSASISDATSASELGYVGGITTNPTLMARESGEPLDQLGRLLAAFPSGPICFQPVSLASDDIAAEARAAAALAPERVVIKLPATLEAIRAAKPLIADGIRCALTAVYSPAQALLAHELGCAWVIPYVDRAARQSVGGQVVVDALAPMLRRMNSQTRILAASLKSVPQLVESILHGADDVSAPLDVLMSLPAHPLTEAAVQEFSAAAARA
jgi:transaldolase